MKFFSGKKSSKKSRLRKMVLGTALSMAFFVCSCGDRAESESPAREQAGNVSTRHYVDTAMGTVVDQTLYTDGEESGEEISEQIMELLSRLEREEISWRLDTSEVYRINTYAGSGEGCPLSQDMAELLGRCLELSEASGGALDITLGRLVRLWDIDRWAAAPAQEGFRVPSPEETAGALEFCGSSKISLVRRTAEGSSGETQDVLFLPEGMQLDLGAVGKGAALSEIEELLEERTEVTGAVVSLGGSILTYGSKPDNSPWRVGIVDPFDTSASVGVLTLEGQWFISTSGDYERYVEQDGVRYHHILDPATGCPAESGVRGVSILSKDGLLSDGLSTACFILGPEEGLELAARYGAEALYVMSDGELILSEGMEEYFRKN